MASNNNITLDSIPLLLTGDLEFRQANSLINTIFETDIKIFNKSYKFLWNDKFEDYKQDSFTNTILDAVINYVFINSTGIIVEYNGKKYLPKKQNMSLKGTNIYFEKSILHPFLIKYLSFPSNIDFFLQRTQYPFSVVQQNRIVCMMKNGYFNCCLDILTKFPQLELYEGYLHQAIVIKLLLIPNITYNQPLDEFIKFLFSRKSSLKPELPYFKAEIIIPKIYDSLNKISFDDLIKKHSEYSKTRNINLCDYYLNYYLKRADIGVNFNSLFESYSQFYFGFILNDSIDNNNFKNTKCTRIGLKQILDSYSQLFTQLGGTRKKIKKYSKKKSIKNL